MPLASLQSPQQGNVMLRFGQLFLNGQKLCSLTNELIGPPGRIGSEELDLRLIGGRCLRIIFQEHVDAAELFFKDCSNSWTKIAAKQGKAASVARKLEMMKASASR